MRVGIITMISNNYGALLQCYALQTVLQTLGHEVLILNRKWGYLKISLSTLDILRNIKNKIYCILKNDPYEKFRSNRLNLTKEIRTYNALKAYKSFFDVVIAGSDQVWNDGCHNVMNFDYYLEWVDFPIVKRYSYAASFGKNTFMATKEDIEAIKKLLHSFSGVSVREDSGLNICKTLFEVEARCDLDPTLLLQTSDYIKMIGKRIKQKNNFLCYYFLDSTEKKEKLISALSNELHIDKKNNMPLNKRYSVEKWLNNFLNSNYVVTDSFHGMVFSIVFKKQFICINNNKRGSARFVSLLGKLNLLDRLLDIDADLSKSLKVLLKPINYDEVDLKLDFYRHQSLDYIKSISNV